MRFSVQKDELAAAHRLRKTLRAAVRNVHHRQSVPNEGNANIGSTPECFHRGRGHFVVFPQLMTPQ